MARAQRGRRRPDLRARHLGWRHVALPGLFVAHDSGKSFGPSGRHLRTRNEAILNRLHPGYAAFIAGFIASDPLFDAKRRLDRERWKDGRRRGGTAAIVITHDKGGGVERQVIAAAQDHAHAGRRAILLRPCALPGGRAGVEVADGIERDFPNLRYALPDELPALLRLLRQDAPDRIEVHHFLGHDPAVYRMVTQLGLPYDVYIHDYAWFCARVSLVGAGDRYCGEPDPAGCEACIADTGSLMKEDIGVLAMLDRSTRFLEAAHSVIAPSQDAARRIKRHFPSVRPRIVPHEDDASLTAPPPARAIGGRCVVCVVGGIGVHKGYDILLACARDAARRDLPIDFIVAGSTIDDARLMATGRVFITGTYAPAEAAALIRAQNASLALLPSIWPETWCLGLADIWRGGLRAVAFDFGAPAERIAKTGWGFVLPPGLPPRGINAALMGAVGLSGGISAGGAYG